MAWTEQREDGTTIIHRPMSRATRQLPTFGLWRYFMSARPEHAEVTEHDQTLFTCIGCGAKLPRLELSNITVGTIVRQTVEEQTGRDEWTESTKVIPAQRRGLGCQACFVAYDNECRTIAQYNANEQELYTLRLALAKTTGEDIRKIPLPKLRTAWVDIGAQVLEDKDNYMAAIERRRQLGLLKS